MVEVTRSDRRLELVGLGASLAILATVAVLRLPNESQWLDEAFTRAAVNDFWEYADSRAGNMFLYMVVVRGFATIDTATWWLRMPSVLAAAGALVLFRPIARRVGGSRLVALALPTLALSVWFQWAATDARAYSLEILVTVAAWLCALLALESPGRDGRKWWLLLALLGGIGVGIHGFFELQLVPIALLVLLRRGFRGAVTVLWPVVLTSAAVLVIFVRAGTVDRVGISTAGGISNWIGETLVVFFGSHALSKVVLLELVLCGVVAAYLHLRRKGLRRSWRILLPLLWMFVPVAVLALVSMRVDRFSARYVIGSLPGVALVLAGATIWLSDRIRSKFGAIWQGGALAAVVGLLMFTTFVTPYPWRQDWRGAVEVVAANARNGDAIVFADDAGQYPEFTRPGFEATWQTSRRAATPAVMSHRRPLGLVRIDDRVLFPSVVAQRVESHDRVWMVQLLTGHDLVDNIALITDDRHMDGYGRVDRWCFDGPIVVELWERGASGSAEDSSLPCR